MIFPNLRAEMARYGIKQKDIAEKLYNGAESRVSERLNGKYQMDIDECIALRDKFFPGMTIDYLFDKNIKIFHEKEGVN